ncbi:hypothetical protein L596_026406 [Steinernema carpocapsae]|uniref:SHSP domain-containing protein n=1 Tax=Steinernema carpocapsae TaxID=34508 RepID=A0A4U5M198_STECR|nr:hypothetical protein L596_026406 [Steinernema carpocapsae]
MCNEKQIQTISVQEASHYDLTIKDLENNRTSSVLQAMVLGKVADKDEKRETAMDGWALANEHELAGQIDHFGHRYTEVRRMSSTDWEIPAGEASSFAKVKDSEEDFQVKIDLGYFEPIYKPSEVDVTVYEHDVQINACKEDPENPNYSLRELHRQYRMPDDVDLETVRMQRKGMSVKVDAKKIDGYGKPVSYSVMDVNKHRADMQYV